MPTTRPRHPFKYQPDPSLSDSDSESDNPALDEQQQETLIANLATSDAARNDIYTRIFTFLPLVGVAVFLWGLRLRSQRGGGGGGGSGSRGFKGRGATTTTRGGKSGGGTAAAVGLLGILGVTSLVASAVEMWFVRLSPASNGSSSNLRSGYYGGGDTDDDGGVARHLSRSRVRRVPFTDVKIDDDGPIGRVLPFLNLGICVLLAGLGGLEALMGRRKTAAGGGAGDDGLWVVLLLPGLILAVVMVVKRSVREVEEGIGELERLRYGYKGA